MIETHKLGRKGEDIAAQFLAKKNHHILERNWRHRKAEIDLISRTEDIFFLLK
jgi:putative endonuclease